MPLVKLVIQSIETGDVLLETSPIKFEEGLTCDSKEIHSISERIVSSHFVTFNTQQGTVVAIHSDTLKHCMLTFEEVAEE